MKIIHTSVEEMAMRRLLIGFEGENQRATVRIDCASVFAEYPNATPALIVKPLFADAYPVVVDRNDTDVDWLITSEILSFTGDGEIQLTFVKDQVICKSAIAKIRVCRSLQVTGDMPDPVAQWVDDANAKLHEVDAQIVELEGMVDTATDAATRAEQSASTAGTAAEQAAGSAATATEKAIEATNAATTATAKAAEAEQSAQAAQIDYSTLSEEVTDLKSSLVLVQANQPIEAVNKLWVDSDTVTETEVPTMDEFNELKRAVVLVQPNQPTEDANKLWVDSDTVTETEVPTMDEFNGLNSAVNSKLNAPETAGTSGQVLTSDGQGGQSWETPSGGGAVQDVQVNGASIVQDGVANVPIASTNGFGAVKVGYGLQIKSSALCTKTATVNELKAGATEYNPVSPSGQQYATFYGLAKAAGSDEKNSSLQVGQYTESAKSAIHEMLNGSVSVSGTTPTINALPGVRYICGEVSTITITVPASGIIDVVFTSGSTPAVLTINGTVRWANGFDPTALDADTVYELNIADGLGVGAAWT